MTKREGMIDAAEDMLHDSDPITDRGAGELNRYVEQSIMMYVTSGWPHDLIAENFSLPISDIEFVIAKRSKAQSAFPK
jgi:hypothetical protein